MIVLICTVTSFIAFAILGLVVYGCGRVDEARSRESDYNKLLAERDEQTEIINTLRTGLHKLLDDNSPVVELTDPIVVEKP